MEYRHDDMMMEMMDMAMMLMPTLARVSISVAVQ